MSLANNVANNHNNVILKARRQLKPVSRLIITEQPQSRGFRFRYQCEGGSHGGLQGETSKRANKTFPTVQITNYKGPARLVVSLVTDNEEPKIHAHELVGKNCKDGICIIDVKETEQMKVRLQGLGVQHVTRKKVADILFNRKIQTNLLHNQMLSKDYKVSASIPLEDDMKMKRQADEDAKDMALSVVRLCFRAYLQDEDGNFTNCLDPVVSQPIYDSKSPGAAALKICRMDKSQGCCKGGDEVFLLCDKVQKEDITVRFFKEDESDRLMWEAYGTFTPTDVHRQFAIVFRTPPYMDCNIDRPVRVYIELKRISDSVKSDPREFIYLPEQTDREEVKRKKMKHIFPPSPEGSDVTDPTEDIYAGGPGATTNETSSFTTSVITTTINSQTFSDLPNLNPTQLRDLPELTDVTDLLRLPEFISDGESDYEGSPHSRVTRTTDSGQEDDFMTLTGLDDSDMDSQEDFIDFTSAERLQKMKELEARREKLAQRRNNTNKRRTTDKKVNKEVDELTERISHLGDDELLNKLPKQATPPTQSRSVQAVQSLACSGDLTSLLSLHKELLRIPNIDGDSCLHQSVIHKQTTVVYSILSALKATCTPVEISEALNMCNDLKQTPVHLAVITNQSAVLDLFLQHDVDLTLADQQGNTSLHLACMDNNYSMLRSLCSYMKQKNYKDQVTSMLNYKGLPCLHSAVLADSLRCVQTLVSYRFTDVNLFDGTSGRTALHHAVVQDLIPIAGHLLLEGNAHVNAIAFDGNTPLHIASAKNYKDMAKLLIACGADPDMENFDVVNVKTVGESGPTTYKAGFTPYMFAKRNKEMMSILEQDAHDSGISVCPPNVLSTELTHTSTEHSPCNSDYGSLKGEMMLLTSQTRANLIKLLDVDSGNSWRQVAEHLDLHSQIEQFDKHHSPATALIQYYEEHFPGSLQLLEDALTEMKHTEALNMMQQTHSQNTTVSLTAGSSKTYDQLHSDVQESGYGTMNGVISIV